MHAAKQIISLIDLTLLNETATEADIAALCDKAAHIATIKGTNSPVAAVCLYPEFVKFAKTKLSAATNTANINVCTVVNFPSGQEKFDDVAKVIKQALIDGADEIDVVLPYHAYLENKPETAISFMRQCRDLIPITHVMKVILETGALKTAELIAQASKDMVQIGVDFLKTSTGKIEVGASLDAAIIMLTVIAEENAANKVGFKVSGGVRSVDDAEQYIHLAEVILGQDWIQPQYFRIGASKLLDELLKNL